MKQTLLTEEEVQGLLGINRRSLQRLRYSRQIPFVRVLGQIRFEQKDVDGFIASQRVEAK